MIDNGIKRFEYSEYEPKARTNFNTGGQIVIEKNQDNMFTLPSKAYLQFEGRLIKADGTSYSNTDTVTQAHNGLMHLFNQSNTVYPTQILKQYFILVNQLQW